MDLPSHFGHTVFCDDIRREEGRKLSFIGAYANVMYVHGQFPFTLPKFGLGITYFQRNKAFNGDLIFQVFFPGDLADAPSIRVDVPLSDLRKAPIPKPEYETWPVGEFHRLDHQLLVAPLVLKQTGTIKVRAIAGTAGDVAKLGILRIGQRIPEPKPDNDPG